MTARSTKASHRAARGWRFLVIYVVVLPAILLPITLMATLFAFEGNETANRLFFRYNTEPADIVFFGDSILRARSACDGDELGIDDHIRDATSASLIQAAHPGYSVRQFAALSGIFNATSHRPKIAILPINLRSFSVGWAENPGWRFVSDMFYIQALGGDLSALPKFVVDRLFSDVESDTANWQSTEIAYRGRVLGRLGDMGERARGVPLDIECGDNEEQYADKLEIMFQLSYLNSVSGAHYLIGEVVNAVESLRGNGITPLVYVSPVNVKDAVRYAGPEIATAIHANVAVLRTALAKHGIEVLDLSTALASDFFADKGCACEHLNYRGRKFVSQRLVTALIATGRL